MSNLTLVARRSVCRGGELPRPGRHISDGYLKMAVFSLAFVSFLSVAGIATIAHAQTVHDEVSCQKKCSSGLPPKVKKCLDDDEIDSPSLKCLPHVADYNDCVSKCENSLEGAQPIFPQAGNVAPDGVLPPDNVYATAELEQDGTVNISFTEPGPGHHEITLRYPPAHPKYKEVKDACVESSFLQPFLCILLNKR